MAVMMKCGDRRHSVPHLSIRLGSVTPPDLDALKKVGI
jgi:hypothetical protein